jgi:hypothetical protein
VSFTNKNLTLVTGILQVIGPGSTTGNFDVGADLNVTGDANITGDLNVTGIGASGYGLATATQSFGSVFSGAPGNITNLSFTAAANAIYRMEMRLHITGDGVFDFRVHPPTLPAGATRYRFQLGATAATTNQLSTSMITTADVSALDYGVANTGAFSIWEDWIVTTGGTAGTVQTRASSSSAGVASTLTLNIGSHIRWERIA